MKDDASLNCPKEQREIARAVRRLSAVENHLQSMRLHLDAAVDEAGGINAQDYDRIFGSAMKIGAGNRNQAINIIAAMLREVRSQLHKLGAIEVV